MNMNTTGRQRRIRAPRKNLGGEEASFEACWTKLTSAFREIHTKNASKLSYEELYRDAYRLVLRQRGEALYTRVRKFEEEWLTVEVLEQVQSLISGSLASDEGAGGSTTGNERRVAGERFLKGIRSAWQEHSLCMGMMADVLMYLDRVYCSDQNRPSIFDTCLSLFRDRILRVRCSGRNANLTILELVSNTMLEQIRMEREGDVIDKNLIRSCVYMLESLSARGVTGESQQLYVTSFEDAFLQTSRDFYKREGEIMLRESDAGTYCRRTKRRIVEEQDRCRSTLSETTMCKIEKVVEEELIKGRLLDLIEMESSGVRFMVDNDRLEELGLVYDLNARVDPKKEQLTKAVQNRIVEMGGDINNAAIAASQAPPPKEDNSENKDKGKAPTNKFPAEKPVNAQTLAALKWVEDVLALKDKFDKIWKISFQSDQYLQTAITRSFTEFINSVSFPRASEYISLFIDDNMKKGLKGKTEDEVDLILEKAITLLRYIQDKDMFERYYKKHLCRRLLMNKSISDDVEQQMISRMKIELGNNFTSKLEAMFKDMNISTDLTDGYKKYLDNLGDRDSTRTELSINVLTSMTWPLESWAHPDEDSGQLKVNYPSAIERLRLGFERYYRNQHNGRQLTWLPNMGSADIKARFPKVPMKDGFKERMHELNVSTYAMIILMLFNDLPSGESIAFEEIQAKTNIPTQDLMRNLQSLACVPRTRILIKEPVGRDVNLADQFSFNAGFQGKFHKIKVGVVAAGNKVEGEKERRETERKNYDSRLYCVEAAIVRIMKQRKELPHARLIAETVSILSGQFKPDVNMIKKRIESLIDREYLERIENAKVPSYRYLA